MSASQDDVLTEPQNASVPPESPVTATAPAAPAPPNNTNAPASTTTKSRPKIDLSALAGAGGQSKDRKRGKSMFGLVLGTLNKAKIEDKERNASEAAKKRQLIEQRLQNKLRKETDSVRRAEEVKKDKSSANRKEEELQLKDSIFKYRRVHIPQFAKFLCTADEIPSDDAESMSPPNPLALPARSHPPPLYYLPAILLPAQEAFLARRAEAVADAVEKEWSAYRLECKAGVEEVLELRKRVAEEERKKKEEREKQRAASGAADGEGEGEGGAPPPMSAVDEDAKMEDAEMNVDEDGGAGGQGRQGAGAGAGVGARSERGAEAGGAPLSGTENGKEESTAMQADEDDAVEY